MDQKVLRIIFQKTKEGDFGAALEMLKQIQLTEDSAVKIFVFASHSCCDCLKSSKKLEDGKLYNILVNIVKYITFPDEIQMLQYMQSLFYILKYFIQQENLKLLSSMEPIIIPTFLFASHLPLNEKTAFTYEQITNILLNYFINVGKRTTECSVELVALNKVIVKGCLKILNLAKMLNSAYKCIKILIRLEAESYQFQEVCVYLLEMLPLSALENSLNNTIQLLSVLEDMFDYLIAGSFFHEANRLLGITKSYLAKETMENVWNVFEFLKIFSPVDPGGTNSIAKWKYSMETFKQENHEFFGKIFQKLYMPLLSLMKFYNSDGVDKWKVFPLDFVTELISCLRWISNCFTEFESECLCQCGLRLDYYRSLKLGSTISYLLKIYIEYNKDLPRDVYQSTKKALFNFMEYLKILKLHNCERWVNLWKELGIHAYNIGTTLYAQNNAVFEDFFVSFLKYSLKYEGKSPTILNVEMYESSFNTICRKRFFIGDYETAMAFAALYCLLYPRQRNTAFQNWWAKSKVELKPHIDRSDLQQMTLVTALENYSASLECITDPRRLLTHSAKVELLSFELERYKAIWKSREAMMAALNQLTAIADLLEVSKVFVMVYGDADVPLHDEMGDLIKKLIEKFEVEIKQNKDLYFKVTLAALYFYHYKSLSKDVIKKHVKEMETTMQIDENSKKIMDPIPKDPNDECDIVSAYESLMLDRHCKMIDILNKGLDILALLAQEKITDMIVANTCHTLLLAFAVEYRLHFFSFRKTQAYELSLNFAEIIGDETKLLYSVGYLIEEGDVDKKLIQDLVLKGDALAKNLEQFCKKDRPNKALITYYICKAKAYLYADGGVSYDAYITARNLYSVCEQQAGMEYLKVELLILNYKLSKSCKRGNHLENPMTFLLHSAMDIVSLWTHSRSISMQAHEICVLFDAVLELAKVYYLMKLPRDLRCYSKNSVLLAQKLLLPLRCVSFLLFLAHSDLLTSKIDHCNVKLNGVDDIFNLDKFKINRNVATCEKGSDNDELEISAVTNQIQELALDLPQHYKQYSPSSPSLMVEGFSLPSFMSHVDECCCFQCMCFEYHLLLLRKHHLHALLNLSQRQIKLGQEFLYGAQTMHSRLREKYARYKLKAEVYISKDLIFDFDDYFMECYGNILFTISSHAHNMGHRGKALDVNSQLLDLLRPKKVKFVYLYIDALIQRQSFLLPVAPCSIKQGGLIDVNSVSDNTSVTPETKQSKVTVSVSEFHPFSPPKRRVKKVILFESPSPDKNGNGAISKAKAGKSVQITPAQTSKLQIYTETKSYSTRLRKKMSDKDDLQPVTDNGVENCQSRRPLILAGVCASTSKKRTQKSKAKVCSTGTTAETVRKNLMQEWAGSKPGVKIMSNDEDSNSCKNESQGCSVIAASQENVCSTIVNARSKDLTEKLKRSMRKKVADRNYDLSKDVTKKLFTEVPTDKPASTKTQAAVRKSGRNRVL